MKRVYGRSPRQESPLGLSVQIFRGQSECLHSHVWEWAPRRFPDLRISQPQLTTCPPEESSPCTRESPGVVADTTRALFSKNVVIHRGTRVAPSMAMTIMPHCIVRGDMRKPLAVLPYIEGGTSAILCHCAKCIRQPDDTPTQRSYHTYADRAFWCRSPGTARLLAGRQLPVGRVVLSK